MVLLWVGHVCLSGAENITSHDEMAPPSFTSSRFTLWHYGRLATQLSRFTLWHNGRGASQLVGRFCGTTAAELNNTV